MCPWVIAFVVSPLFVDEEQVDVPRAVPRGQPSVDLQAIKRSPGREGR
jgi:hypothetical protein